jgi:predicted nuclease of restriction endonuclease-like (RecB) superfamily
MSTELKLYRDLLADIKGRVRAAQHKAALSANAEMILMYWDIGRLIAARQEREGWGAGVIPRLAVDLKNELPEQKGFSARNIGYMIRFAREYGPPPILPPPAAKLGDQTLPPLEAASSSAAIALHPAAPLAMPAPVLFGLPWFHHVILIEKTKDLPTRHWYARQAVAHSSSTTCISVASWSWTSRKATSNPSMPAR